MTCEDVSKVRSHSFYSGRNRSLPPFPVKLFRLALADEIDIRAFVRLPSNMGFKFHPDRKRKQVCRMVVMCSMYCCWMWLSISMWKCRVDQFRLPPPSSNPMTSQRHESLLAIFCRMPTSCFRPSNPVDYSISIADLIRSFVRALIFKSNFICGSSWPESIDLSNKTNLTPFLSFHFGFALNLLWSAGLVGWSLFSRSSRLCGKRRRMNPQPRQHRKRGWSNSLLP